MQRFSHIVPILMSAAALEGGNGVNQTAPVQNANRDATKADAHAIALASYRGSEALKGITKQVKTLKSGLRTGTTGDSANVAMDALTQAGITSGPIFNIVKNISDLQDHYAVIAGAPRGTNMKGGASREDLINALAGAESQREVTNRVKATWDAYGVNA